MSAKPSFPFHIVNPFLLRKQHLHPETRIPDVLQIARDAGGLHATVSTTPYLSLWARSPGFERASLDRELGETRALARIRCVRGTIYVQPRDWIPAYLAATRRRNTAQTVNLARRSGITERRYERLSADIAAILAGTSMRVASIRRALGFEGDLSAVLYRMCDEGILLRGQGGQGWKDRGVHYRLFPEVFPEVGLASIGEAQAMAAVVEQYLRCFGPACEGDIAWWTGFGKSEVRRALTEIGPRLVHVHLGEDGRPGLMLQEDVESLGTVQSREGPLISLLPLLDGYLMGYRERDRYLRPEHRDFVFDRGGNVTSTVLVNGEIAGVWDWEEKPRPVVKVHYLVRVSREARTLIEEEAKRLGRFLSGQDVEVSLCESMAPLVARTAGGFQSPLKGVERRR